MPEHSQRNKMSENEEGCTLHSEISEGSRWRQRGGANTSNTGLLTEDCSHAVHGSSSKTRHVSRNLIGQVISDLLTEKVKENKCVC